VTHVATQKQQNVQYIFIACLKQSDITGMRS